MNESHRAFTGSIPENYDRYMGSLFFEDYARDLAQRTLARHPTQVLEIAAGTGIVSRHLRSLLPPDVSLMVTDLNVAMLEYAQRKFELAENIEFRQADALALPFPDRSFDAVVCQFGFMFFLDKLSALGEVARVLKPGGSFLFSVWDAIEQNDLTRVLMPTFTELLAGNKSAFFDVPFGFYQLDPLKTMVEATGFHSIELSIVKRENKCAAASDVALAYLTGTPFSLEFAQRSDVSLDEAIGRTTQTVAAAYGDPPVGAKMQAIIITARSARA